MWKLCTESNDTVKAKWKRDHYLDANVNTSERFDWSRAEQQKKHCNVVSYAKKHFTFWNYDYGSWLSICDSSSFVRWISAGFSLGSQFPVLSPTLSAIPHHSSSEHFLETFIKNWVPWYESEIAFDLTFWYFPLNVACKILYSLLQLPSFFQNCCKCGVSCLFLGGWSECGDFMVPGGFGPAVEL